MSDTTTAFLQHHFGLSGKVAIITGGTGALGSAMALGLASAGARVAVLGRREERAREIVNTMQQGGGEGMPLPADVLDRDQLERARDAVLAKWGSIDILVNAAGGNVPAATLPPGKSFFDMAQEGFEEVIALNLYGTMLPTQVFGAEMGKAGSGAIVNISSMAAQRSLTRVLGYGIAKAAVDNATRWLAVELARTVSPQIRVNAIAPGFFVGEQNRALLLNTDGSLTPRGQTIIDHTPAGRFGSAEELIATLIWLCAPGASFVNGVVVPVDGGFSAFSGV